MKLHVLQLFRALHLAGFASFTNGNRAGRNIKGLILGALKMVSRLWIGLGLMALSYGFFLSACTPVTSVEDIPRANVDATPEEDARLAEATRLWVEESGMTSDVFSAGKAAYDIAAITHDHRWAQVANRKLAEARKLMPGFAQATAWQGSAQSLIARDYPLQGAWQVLPGPGFVRIYHVKRAESLLNEAVALAPKDPVVRLLRAATISRMPKSLVDHETAMQDFAILARWEADPGLNPGHIAVLTSDDWRRAFLDARARAARSDPQMENAVNKIAFTNTTTVATGDLSLATQSKETTQ